MSINGQYFSLSKNKMPINIVIHAGENNIWNEGRVEANPTFVINELDGTIPN